MEVIVFNNMVWDLLRDISLNMENAFKPLYDKYGLTAMQVRILEDIRLQEHTIGSLGKNLCVAGGNISAMCRKLEKEGFIERFRDKVDERVVKVVLSEKGQSIIVDIENCLQSAYYPFLEAELPDNLNDIIQGLQKLNVMLCKLNNLNDCEDGKR